MHSFFKKVNANYILRPYYAWISNCFYNKTTYISFLKIICLFWEIRATKEEDLPSTSPVLRCPQWPKRPGWARSLKPTPDCPSRWQGPGYTGQYLLPPRVHTDRKRNRKRGSYANTGTQTFTRHYVCVTHLCYCTPLSSFYRGMAFCWTNTPTCTCHVWLRRMLLLQMFLCLPFLCAHSSVMEIPSSSLGELQGLGLRTPS